MRFAQHPMTSRSRYESFREQETRTTDNSSADLNVRIIFGGGGGGRGIRGILTLIMTDQGAFLGYFQSKMTFWSLSELSGALFRASWSPWD